MNISTTTPRLRQTVIYVMECAGYHYGGKHEVGPRHSVSGWPSEGGSALPDGYRGSGKAWLNVVRKHGLENVRWKILVRFEAPTLAEVDAAERGGIAGLRELNGERCVNLREGAVMTSADMLKMFEDLEYKAKIAEANRRKAQDPGFRDKHKAATTDNPEWRAATAEAMRRRSQDPNWRAATAEANRRPEVRAKNAESNGSIPAAPPAALSVLRQLFLSAPKSWTKRELFARATLRVPEIPVWQFTQVANEAGIVVSGDNSRANVLRYIQTLLPQIVITEEQSADLLIARVLALKASGISVARACWQASLEMRDVALTDARSAASAAGLNPRGVSVEVSLARALARIIREESAPLPAAA